MSLDLTAVQTDILAQMQNQVIADSFPFPVIDTEVPTATTVERVNNRIQQYAVIRFTDGVPLTRGKSFGGPRHDEMTTNVDILGIGATPALARAVVWGPVGANAFLTGYKPVDASPLYKRGGGQVFEVSDAQGKPAFFIARSSFGCLTNMENVS